MAGTDSCGSGFDSLSGIFVDREVVIMLCVSVPSTQPSYSTEDL